MVWFVFDKFLLAYKSFIGIGKEALFKIQASLETCNG